MKPLKGLILDMDGVLWRGPQPIGDLGRVFARIDLLGLKVALASNNAAPTVAQFQAKLAGMGANLERWQIVNAPAVAGEYLRRRFPDGDRVYIVGEDGLAEAMHAHGFEPSEQDPCAVVVGLDRTLTYDKLATATRLIRNGVPFIGTNPDKTLPVPNGFAPGAGAILAALQTATDVEPLVVGKPQPEIYVLAMARMGVTADETLVVGDRLDTDMVGAQALGCRAGLVLSGVSNRAEGHAWRPALDYIEADLSALLERLAAER